MQVGAKLEKPIKIDEATSLVSRGHFAKKCVEVDLSKPLVSRFKLGRRIRRVEYEGIHLICFECGMYGHRREACLSKPSTDQTTATDQEATDATGVQATNDRVDEQGMIKGSAINPEILDKYGPWMLAQKRVRRSQNKQEVSSKERKQPVEGKMTK